MAKCPKCDKVISSPHVEELRMQSLSWKYDALAISCPSCYSVLGIMANPHVLVDEMVQKLKAGK